MARFIQTYIQEVSPYVNWKTVDTKSRLPFKNRGDEVEVHISKPKFLRMLTDIHTLHVVGSSTFLLRAFDLAKNCNNPIEWETELERLLTDKSFCEPILEDLLRRYKQDT